jgi:tetrahydromethanopterin S-methyltransferase subunit A
MARLNKRHIGPTWMLTCTVAALPLLVQADESKIDGRALGATEAILNYCAKIDPKAAERYQQQIKLLVQGVPEAVLVEVRSSEDYKQARESAEDSLTKVGEHDAKQACASSVAPTK